MKKDDLTKLKIGRVFTPHEQLSRQIPPEPHTAMYVWHKYWSRKTWNVVGEFIKNYTGEQHIVFDPFAGSGVSAIEAVRNHRRAIACDLNPTASLITELTLRPVNLTALLQAFEGVRDRARKEIDALYEIHCLKCGKPLAAACALRHGDDVTEVRYPGCPHCGHRSEINGKLRSEDVAALAELERKKIPEWYPRHRLYYDDGAPFKEKQRYESLDELFTKRNLRAAALLYAAIEAEKSPVMRKFLMGAFSSMIHLCTRMMPVCNPSPSNHATSFSSPGWTQHSYWSAPVYMEQNVWLKFESSVTGNQGLIKAKEESTRELGKVKLTDDWREVLSGKADAAVITNDCIELMKEMPDDCIDYIFTDPPYDASIQYGELSFLWNAWLKKDYHYTEKLVVHEIIRNERQRKSFEVYHSLIGNSFNEFYRVLMPGRYLTLTFHNPTFKVRNATVRAGVFAGLDYLKIHHQPLARTSPKALLQPFGSADGDFYLRFQKPFTKQARTMEEVTETRFRSIVIETCREVIAERAEPTPYTILINYVDPVLAKMGLFGTLDTGLDVKKVLEEAVGQDFVLLKAKMGGVEGKLWWFKDPVFVARLQEVPLTERVEQTVLRVLNQRGRVTFTDVWNAVSQQFPNSLTSDSTSIKEALEVYARKTGPMFWMLRDEIRLRERSHPEIIALLALIGKAQGFDIWIGRNEQGTRAGGLMGDMALRELVTAHPKELENVKNAGPVLDMDLLWLHGDKVEMAFEVESTTTMTSGLLRGSNLPATTPKIMVLPEERDPDFQRKMESPLFAERFTGDGWARLYFDTLRQAFTKTREKTRLDMLYGKLAATTPLPAAGRKVKPDDGQLVMDLDGDY